MYINNPFACGIKGQYGAELIMCRMIGFIMFWIALGMIISMFIESVFVSVSIIFLLIICGFNMFCH